MYTLIVLLMIRRPARSTHTYTLFPYTALFRAHAGGRHRRRLAVRGAAPGRGHLLGPERRLDGRRGGAARQLPLSPAGRAALADSEHRHPPRPPPCQSHPLLSSAAGAARPSRARRHQPPHLPAKPRLHPPRPLGRKPERSEDRRVGNECVSTLSSRWSSYS